MNKVCLSFFIFVLSIQLSTQTLEEDVTNQINNSNRTGKTLSRKRRYLVFPSGSSLQLVYCLTVPSVGVGEIFTLGQTAALAWELPDKPDFIYDLIDHKKGKTTTEAPETTTLPPLHHDHDYDDHQPYYDHPSKRLDAPLKYASGGWTSQSGKYPGGGAVKTYYDPLLIGKPSTYGYNFVDGILNRARPVYSTLQGNTFSGQSPKRRPVQAAGNSYQSSSYYKNYQNSNKVKQVTTYAHPAYHQLHRRTRRDLYGKVEKLFTALSRDGKACLLKAICEVSQAAQKKGTFMEEIIKAIFRVKPHDSYPDEDDYDRAANKTHNCVDLYPTCEGTIWSSMLNP